MAGRPPKNPRRVGRPHRALLFLFLPIIIASCGRPPELFVRIDGSSTVFPIAEAVAEEFLKEEPRVRVTIGVSGTGGGFEKFANGEIDIQNASRAITPSEAAAASNKGVDYLELPVAFDGLTVVVHTENTWVDYLTLEELRALWMPGSGVDSWDDLREGWPAQPIHLYGPSTDSGTFDYFTEAVVGEVGASRPDYTASEDDNVLITGVANDRYALGYFGYAYYVENQERLKAVPIESGRGPIAPTPETINEGSYAPLSRPVFIYVNRKALQRPEVFSFVRFMLTHGPDLVREVGYVPLPAERYAALLEQIE